MEYIHWLCCINSSNISCIRNFFILFIINAITFSSTHISSFNYTICNIITNSNLCIILRSNNNYSFSRFFFCIIYCTPRNNSIVCTDVINCNQLVGHVINRAWRLYHILMTLYGHLLSIHNLYLCPRQKASKSGLIILFTSIRCISTNNSSLPSIHPYFISTRTEISTIFINITNIIHKKYSIWYCNFYTCIIICSHYIKSTIRSLRKIIIR